MQSLRRFRTHRHELQNKRPKPTKKSRVRKTTPLNTNTPLLRLGFRIGLNTAALKDTGAAASFIRASIFYRINEEYITEDTPDTYPTFKSATGNPIQPLGYYKILITIGTLINIIHPFYVVTELPEKCILGLDFLTKYEVVIHTKNRTLTVEVNGKKHIVKVEHQPRLLFRITVQQKESFQLGHLTDENRRRMEALLRTNFATGNNDLGCTNRVKHTILTTGEVVALQPYRTPIALLT